MSAPRIEVQLASKGVRRRWSGDRVVVVLVLLLVAAAVVARAAWRRVDPRMAVTDALDRQTNDYRWASLGGPTRHRDGTVTGGAEVVRALVRPAAFLEARDPWGRPWAVLPRDLFGRPVVATDHWGLDGGFFLSDRDRVLAALVSPPTLVTDDPRLQRTDLRWFVYSRGPDGEDEGGLGDDLRPYPLGEGDQLVYQVAGVVPGVLALLLACAWIVVRELRAPRAGLAREAARCAVIVLALTPALGSGGWLAGLILQHRFQVRPDDLSPSLSLPLSTVVPLTGLALATLLVVALRARRARLPGA